MNCAIYMLFDQNNTTNNSKTLSKIKKLAKRRRLKIKSEYFDIKSQNNNTRQRLSDLLKDIQTMQIEYLLVPNISNLITKYEMIPHVLDKIWQQNIIIMDGNGNIVDPDLWKLLYNAYRKSSKEMMINV